MQDWQMTALGVAAVILVAAVVWVLYKRNRTRRLRDERVQRLKEQPLNSAEQHRFLAEWRLCQARFVDDPPGAVNDANRIVTELMRTRGYCVDDARERMADVCAAYPKLGQSYREANEIVIRHGRGRASTDDLRKAFLNFRSLFDEVIEEHHQEFRRAS